MSVQAYNPKTSSTTPSPHTSDKLTHISEPSSAPSDDSCSCGGTHHSHHAHEHEAFTPIGLVEDDDGIRIMPTSDDLTKPSSDAEFIKQALSEEKKDHSKLIASSRQTLPNISVNGVAIAQDAIARETQYHPASSQEEALYLAAQALTVRELLRQAVQSTPELGDSAWQADEEAAIAKLIEMNVAPKTPERTACQQYYDNNPAQFVTTPIMQVRHILLSAPPEAGEERITLKQKASELIDTLQNSDNKDADFIELARKHSACPSKDDGGELGTLHKGQTVPEFEQAVFALPVGVGVNPIESRYGIHIVDVMAKKDGRTLSFDEAYPAIENQLKQQSFHHALCDYLYRLGQEANITGIELQMNEENVYRG